MRSISTQILLISTGLALELVKFTWVMASSVEDIFGRVKAFVASYAVPVGL